MILRHIELKDWKAFVNARFDFPVPSNGRNVILIGAKNGYGKTSLFEAIVLGLFGRRGLPLIARAPFGGADDGLQTSYRNFLNESLHRNAIRDGRTLASVELAFDDDDGEPLIIRRIWHFSADGKNKPQDEEVRIYAGKNERPVAPPPGEDPIEWKHAFIERKFLPHYLAAFFLFDGEHVQILAKQEMSDQVRKGIEGLLGIPVLRVLAEDLKKYADNRLYRAGGNVPEKTLERTRCNIEVCDTRLKDVNNKLEEVLLNLQQHTARRETLTRELGALGANGSEISLKERYEELNRVKRALEELRGQLQGQVMGGLALALAGSQLRHETDDRLRQEAIRESWEAGLKQGEEGLGRFLQALEVSLSDMTPPLSDVQRTDLMAKIQETWSSIWFPPPDGCANGYCHGYLRGADREAVRHRLKEIGALSSDLISGILNQIAQGERDQARIEGEIAQFEGIGPRIEVLVAELRELSAAINRLTLDKGRLEQETKGLTAELGQKRQELARLVQTKDRAAPALKRAERANHIARIINAIIEESVPPQIKTVAEEMSVAYRAMAHKSVVQSVAIEKDCTVKLMSRAGRNVREMSLSAGEQQIFAQALISSVSKVSQRVFPIVVDTPLGRLDDAHRSGVLKHFTAREGQVFLLSTDTEIVGRYFRLMEPRLAKAYHLTHEHDGHVGRTTPVEGYFEGVGA